MFSFRYHLVSIVAVFLALALGVLLGTTVVNQGLIDDLNRRTDAAVKRVDELNDQVRDLEGQVRTWEAFGAVAQPLLVEGQLVGHQSVVVTLDDVNAVDVDGARRSLEEAGATVTGILVARPKMSLSSDPDRQAMATLLGMSSNATAEDLIGEAGRQLGARLASGPPLTGDDLLAQLVDQGFLALRGGTGLPSSVGGAGQSVVFVSGSESPPAVDPVAFFVPAVTSLVQSASPVVATETVRAGYPFVANVRQDDTLDGTVATVDNMDTMPGRVALVLSLRDLLATPSQGGNYGVKPGAATLLPKS
jgi:Copper transport outer membrane protein, MctB